MRAVVFSLQCLTALPLVADVDVISSGTIIGVLVNSDPGVVFRICVSGVSGHDCDISQWWQGVISGGAHVDPLPFSPLVEVLVDLVVPWWYRDGAI